MNRSEAEDHLRVIRSLMEKATIYRAVSAPTALIGGLLTCVVGGLLAGPWREQAEDPQWFFLPWIAVLTITGTANVFFIRRDAQRRGDPFFSSGMKMALQALLPTHFVAGFITVLAWVLTSEMHHSRLFEILPGLWCVLYGLGLLAMSHFAPRSLIWLGWCFLMGGLLICALYFLVVWSGLLENLTALQMSNLAMVGTFGLFHLGYGLAAWPRAKAAETAAPANIDPAG